MNNYSTIENLRKIAGTLPSEEPIRRTKYLSLIDSIEVSLEDHNENPYKTMFVTATATWGDNQYEQKWNKTSAEGKLEVIKAVLTNNTLPQAREMVNFVFRVRGTPRWMFDYHTQIKFTSFMSIGCRDNNKIDCDFIFDQETKIDKDIKSNLESLKDLYEYVLNQGGGSWQSARTFLPQCYQHSYHFGQNLLSIASMKNFRVLNTLEDATLFKLYLEIYEKISKKFPLIGLHISSIFRKDNREIFDTISKLELKDIKQEDLNLLDKNYAN